MTTYLLLPAWNEGPALAELLPKALELPSSDLRIVVLDDGSTDDTGVVAGSFPGVEILRHDTNRGLGAALTSLLEFTLATASDDDVAVIMDADNTMDPGLIPTLRAAAYEGADVVIASRYRGTRQVGVPWWRAGLSVAARIVFQSLFRLRGVRDVTCGYRLYRVGLLRRLAHDGRLLLRSTGFTASTELLVLSARAGARIREVPFELRYDQKRGGSKMRVGRTIAAYGLLFLYLKLRMDLSRRQTAFTARGDRATTPDIHAGANRT